MQTAINEASRLVETARRDPLGMPLTWLTSSMPYPGCDQPPQQFRQCLSRTFHAGRNDAGRNHGRLEQAKIVLGKVKHVGQRRDLGMCPQVHADETQDWLVDHAEV